MTVDVSDRTSYYSGPLAQQWPGRRAPAPAEQPRSGPAAAVSEAVYSVISFPIALTFFIGTWVMCSVGAGLAVIWIGVPVLALGLLVARFGAFLQLGLYESMTGRSLGYRGPRPRRPRRGPMGKLALVITDPGSWRALGYWLLKMVLAPVQFGLAIGLYGYGLGAITYSVWQRWLPAQRATDGSWHRGAQWGTDFFIDSWPEMVVLGLLGVGVLLIAPAIIRVVTSIDRALLIGFVAGRDRG